MCGILALISKQPIHLKDEFLPSLESLEYRGYDSAGIATKENQIEKTLNRVSSLKDHITTSAIGHTRWATQGEVNLINTHPHKSREIILVHNGILENASELKRTLEKEGYNHISATDTETIAHFLQSELDKKNTILESLKKFSEISKGNYAIVLFYKENIYFMHKGSPLLIASSKDKVWLSSDSQAFPNYITKISQISEDKPFKLDFDTNFPTEEIIRTKKADKKGYQYYMLKEIHEESESAKKVIKENYEKISGKIKKADSISFIACGTSYHAAKAGEFFFNSKGIFSKAYLASEEKLPAFLENNQIIALSQSGETMDVLEAIKAQKNIISILNVKESTLSRKSDEIISMQAGPEKSVASTKTYLNQLIILAKLAGYNPKIEPIKKALEQDIKPLAQKLKNQKNLLILGTGLGYVSALEAALKLKEVSYLHAEAIPLGELKHGPLALIEPNTPILILGETKEYQIQELKTRGAEIIQFPYLPKDSLSLFLAETIQSQLLSYELGIIKGCPIDFPRNLAKSVTVR